ncbi:MAG: nitrogenase component 1 [Christensenella hongkongensis]|uniref:nitrogenase component 1 n=1 Tax=Christensenella hongkongensis TaxID=270498 RepID=UPI002671DA3D|nr:nitrogenase component 1 [Christensenella hongkongensis]MDY3005377.1 nitrogenase component 1 [Christensenella hongkongensis]
MPEQTFDFETTLQYSSPARGGWSIVRMAMQVPQSYQLFVGPSACMRHIMLSSMELKIDDRISWLFIKESDIVSGSYEQLILRNVDEMLGQMNPRPRVFMIFVTCIDNLLGTDHDVFLKPLNEKYPETQSMVCFMNPITGDGPAPPAVTIQDTMYSLLEKSGQKERAVNFIGNNLAVEENNELVLWLKEHGIRSNHISNYETFDDFMQMGKSMLNIVVTPLALYAAKQMKLKKGIDYLYLPVSYTFDEIENGIREVCGKFEIEPPQLETERQKAQEALLKAAVKLDGRPVCIDYAATYRPFGMARLLLEHGICVDTIYASECLPAEREDLRWLMKYKKEVRITQPEHYTMPGHVQKNEDYLCIGFEAAYFTGSPHVVPLAADGEQYGFAGVRLLAERMQRECDHSYDLEKLVKDSGLVV